MWTDNPQQRFDVYKIEGNGTRTWRESFHSFQEALKSAIALTFEEHADCFIADIGTGEQPEFPIWRSGE